MLLCFAVYVVWFTLFLLMRDTNARRIRCLHSYHWNHEVGYVDIICLRINFSLAESLNQPSKSDSDFFRVMPWPKFSSLWVQTILPTPFLFGCHLDIKVVTEQCNPMYNVNPCTFMYGLLLLHECGWHIDLCNKFCTFAL